MHMLLLSPNAPIEPEQAGVEWSVDLEGSEIKPAHRTM